MVPEGETCQMLKKAAVENKIFIVGQYLIILLIIDANITSNDSSLGN